MKRTQILLLLLLLLAACTQEQLEDCPQSTTLDIEVVDTEGEDITAEGAVDKLSLYIFDNNRRFLKSVSARADKSLSIYFADQDTLYVVSWGNLSNERQQLPELMTGAPMSEAVIQLMETKEVQPQQDRATTTRTMAKSPDDLFYSYDVISLKSGGQTKYELQMNRAVGSMAITLRHLQSYANRYDERYSLVVRETYNGIDFYGRLTGNKVGYRPAVEFNDKQEFVAPLFNLLPSHAEGVIEIDVYHENMLITTVKNNSQGKALKVLRGQVLNVLVDFRLQVSVEVSITPWGITHVWKEF